MAGEVVCGLTVFVAALVQTTCIWGLSAKRGSPRISSEFAELANTKLPLNSTAEGILLLVNIRGN